MEDTGEGLNASVKHVSAMSFTSLLIYGQILTLGYHTAPDSKDRPLAIPRRSTSTIT